MKRFSLFMYLAAVLNLLSIIVYLWLDILGCVELNALRLAGFFIGMCVALLLSMGAEQQE